MKNRISSTEYGEIIFDYTPRNLGLIELIFTGFIPIFFPSDSFKICTKGIINHKLGEFTPWEKIKEIEINKKTNKLFKFIFNFHSPDYDIYIRNTELQISTKNNKKQIIQSALLDSDIEKIREIIGKNTKNTRLLSPDV